MVIPIWLKIISGYRAGNFPSYIFANKLFGFELGVELTLAEMPGDPHCLAGFELQVDDAGQNAAHIMSTMRNIFWS